MRFLRLIPCLACFCLVAAHVAAQSDNAEAPALAGRVEGRAYLSPTGQFRIEIPVLAELDGVVNDTANVVTFQDGFSYHASIACFPMDATQRWENETRGRKDYLIWFFGNFVQPDFQQRYQGAHIQSARFIPSLEEGALLAFNILPGGSMFYGKIFLSSEETPPAAKRGNLLFVKNRHIYVLSMELSEKVTERLSFKKTEEEENEILRGRLIELLAKIAFTPPEKTDK